MQPDKVLVEWCRAVRLMQVAQFRAAARCEYRHRWIGVPAVVLSTVVGTSIFATLQENPAIEIKIVVGLFSILSAVLTSIQLFLRQADLSEKHRSSAALFGELRRELEGMIGGPPPVGDAWTAFAISFRHRWSEVERQAPTVSQNIHDQALKHIAARKSLE